MTILLIILLILAVIYLYYQNQQLKANAPSFPGSQSEIIFSAEELEIRSLREEIAKLQAQIKELKKDND
jgi:cell division protein FtsB